MHEFGNMIQFIKKWDCVDFRKGFIVRMKKRIDEAFEGDIENSNEELKRLVEKYWKIQGSKIEEHHFAVSDRIREKGEGTVVDSRSVSMAPKIEPTQTQSEESNNRSKASSQQSAPSNASRKS
jgi:hypothetical protein